MRFMCALLLICGVSSLFSQDVCVRAAIDFGSGAVKIQMAVVDVEKNCIIGAPLLSKYILLSLTEDVASHGGRISGDMAQKGLSILQGIKEEAQSVAASFGYHTVHFSGVATAVFRKAENGIDLLHYFAAELGIPFQILSQDEEGKLGFLAAKALYPEVAEPYLLAWDSGNGSFQMTIKEDSDYTVLQGPIGHGTVRVILSKDIRKGPILKTHESGNPVFKEEACELTQRIRALLPPIPAWLKERLKADHTVIATFGDGESIFAVTAQAIAHDNGITEPINEAIISFADVQRVIDTYLEKDDAVFKEAGLHLKTLMSAVHLSALMDYFGMDCIHYKRALGVTSGMLIAPQLWEEQTPVDSIL